MNTDKPPRAWWQGKMWLVYELVWNPNMLLTRMVLARVGPSGPDIRYLNHVEKEEDENPILMWPTGLQDKNGTEGYHKDLVKPLPGLPETDENYRLLTIEWSEEEARFYLAEPDGSESNCVLKHFYLMEIVGNIYQHPGLLKKE